MKMFLSFFFLLLVDGQVVCGSDIKIEELFSFKKVDIYYIKRNESYDLMLTPNSVQSGQHTYRTTIISPAYMQEFVDSVDFKLMQRCENYDELTSSVEVRLYIHLVSYSSEYHYFSDGEYLWDISANECMPVDNGFLDRFVIVPSSS